MKNVYSIFGLNNDQIEIMYSLERIQVKHDIIRNPKTAGLREKWLGEWCGILQQTFSEIKPLELYTEDNILPAIKRVAESSVNQTWFYIAMLEAVLFNAYFILCDEKEANKTKKKEYRNLKFDSDLYYLKKVARESGLMDEEYVDRFNKTYAKSYDRITGKGLKIAFGVATIVAVTAITGGLAAVFAGPIAVSLFGSSFALYGAALTNACLAMAGGGAIAAGGAGVAGGVLAIAGGGAILGAAAGSAGGAATIAFAKNAPNFTLSQTAKLEVVMKEILLNIQHDIMCAQEVMDSMHQQIITIQEELTKLQLAQEQDKKAISNMKISISALHKAYKEMLRFKSSYETGVETEKGAEANDGKSE